MKHSNFQQKCCEWLICFIRGSAKIIKVEKQCLLLNYAFVKKLKTTPIFFLTKYDIQRFLECARPHVLKFPKKMSF